MPNNIVITGGTSGIGIEVAKSLILKGCSVYIVGRDREKFSSSIYSWCSERGVPELCNWIQHDFLQPGNTLKDELKKIPVLSGYVNCAGILNVSPLKLQKVDDIIDVINVNLVAPVLFTRELLKFNLIGRNASLVYISSINGVKVGSKAHTVYSATKAGIGGFVMSLANELSSLGIRVNAIAPGSVLTPMLEKTKRSIGETAFVSYAQKYPLGMGTPMSLVPLINFLLDHSSSAWITGQNFVVDGGYSLN